MRSAAEPCHRVWPQCWLSTLPNVMEWEEVPQDKIERLQRFVGLCHKDDCWATKNSAPVKTEHALRELGLACFEAGHAVRASIGNFQRQ